MDDYSKTIIIFILNFNLSNINDVLLIVGYFITANITCSIFTNKQDNNIFINKNIMGQFSTIHVFGYGETQIIGETNNGKVQSSSLTTLTPFVDHVKTFLPATGVTLTDYHVIHIFDGMDVRYLGQGTEDRTVETSFSVTWAEIDQTLLTALVDEIILALPA